MTKKFGSEYTIVTILKDVLYKCWVIQIYIPKSSRILTGQVTTE
jgi:hypothetical protein